MCVPTEFNVMAKTHVCFRHDASQALLHNTRIPKLSPHLTLAMAAVVTLPATLLINHRVTATLWAKIARDTQMAQA